MWQTKHRPVPGVIVLGSALERSTLDGKIVGIYIPCFPLSCVRFGEWDECVGAWVDGGWVDSVWVVGYPIPRGRATTPRLLQTAAALGIPGERRGAAIELGKRRGSKCGVRDVAKKQYLVLSTRFGSAVEDSISEGRSVGSNTPFSACLLLFWGVEREGGWVWVGG